MTRQLKSILVTGGCGFIGSSFIRALFQRDDFAGRAVNLDALTYAGNPDNVTGSVDEGRYHFVHGNICDTDLVRRVCREHQIDAIVHFAAESHVDRSIHGPKEFVQSNVVGTHSLLEVVRERPDIHFHHVSTDEVYGSLGDTGAFREDSRYQPSSPYAASKAASDHFVRAYAHTYDVSVTISNCSNNYGPYQFPEKLIPLMILNMQARKRLPVYGDGSNVRDWLYVDDHADALWTILRDGRRGETYHIGGECELRNLDLLHRLIDVVAELTGAAARELRGLIELVEDRPGHDQRYAIDCQKVKSELGWTQRHTIRQGLVETVRWYLEHPDWVERVQSGEYRRWLETNYAKR